MTIWMIQIKMAVRAVLMNKTPNWRVSDRESFNTHLFISYTKPSCASSLRCCLVAISVQRIIHVSFDVFIHTTRIVNHFKNLRRWRDAETRPESKWFGFFLYVLRNFEIDSFASGEISWGQRSVRCTQISRKQKVLNGTNSRLLDNQTYSLKLYSRRLRFLDYVEFLHKLHKLLFDLIHVLNANVNV